MIKNRICILTFSEQSENEDKQISLDFESKCNEILNIQPYFITLSYIELTLSFIESTFCDVDYIAFFIYSILTKEIQLAEIINCILEKRNDWKSRVLIINLGHENNLDIICTNQPINFSLDEIKTKKGISWNKFIDYISAPGSYNDDRNISSQAQTLHDCEDNNDNINQMSVNIDSIKSEDEINKGNDNKEKRIKPILKKIRTFGDIFGDFKRRIEELTKSGESDIKCPSGLRNTCEKCYMNSMIQALAASENLIDKLSNILKNDDQNRKLEMLVKLLKKINDNAGVDECTIILMEFMKEVNLTWTTQADVFQSLSFFINEIEKDLINEKLMPPKIEILHAFSEDAKYNRLQSHLALAIPIGDNFATAPGEKINVLMDLFFAPSVIDDGKYSTSMFIFGAPPDVLILHIQANMWSYRLNSYTKPKYYIEYEEQLQYTFQIAYKMDGSDVVPVTKHYQLVAVIDHMGDVSGGHYVTYRRLGKRWYKANDSHVTSLKFQCNVVPYILIYEARSSE